MNVKTTFISGGDGQCQKIPVFYEISLHICVDFFLGHAVQLLLVKNKWEEDLSTWKSFTKRDHERRRHEIIRFPTTFEAALICNFPHPIKRYPAADSGTELWHL